MNSDQGSPPVHPSMSPRHGTVSIGLRKSPREMIESLPEETSSGEEDQVDILKQLHQDESLSNVETYSKRSSGSPGPLEGHRRAVSHPVWIRPSRQDSAVSASPPATSFLASGRKSMMFTMPLLRVDAPAGSVGGELAAAEEVEKGVRLSPANRRTIRGRIPTFGENSNSAPDLLSQMEAPKQISETEAESESELMPPPSNNKSYTRCDSFAPLSMRKNIMACSPPSCI